MSYIEKSISIDGTELQFLQAFINAITAADERITCTTNDLETQFADTSNKPTFTLSVDGIYTITFTRDTALSRSYHCYNVSSSGYYGNPTLSYSDTGCDYNAKNIRKWKFSVVANSEDIYLKLAPHNGNLNSPIIEWLSIKNNDISIYAVQSPNSYSSTNIISIDFKTIEGQEYKKVDRLLYTYNSSDSTKIELIKSKTFVEKGTTNRAFEANKIIDSTTVTAGRDISINSTRYYALDSNTLMEIE